MRLPRLEPAILIGVVVVFAIGVVMAVAVNTAFGYDESVYAVAARYWVAGTPASGWDIHRPPFLSVIGVLPTLLGGQEWQFRLVGAAFGTATVVATWWLGRMVAGPAVGLIAAVAVAAAASFQRESGVFLTDVPSTLVLLITTGWLFRHLNGPRPIGRSFLWLAPLAATAFYLRYGAVIALVALGIAAIGVSGRRVRDGWRWVGLTLLLLAVLAIPHMIFATAVRGEPWGIVLQAGNVVDDARQLPLLDYLGWLPSTLFGPLGGLLAVLAVVVVIARIVRLARRTPAQLDPRGRFVGFVAIAAGSQLLVYGTVVHAEPRYLIFPMILLVMIGAFGVVALAQRFRLKAAVPLALAGSAVLLVLGVIQSVGELQQRGASHDWTREVGTTIGAQSAGDCSILTSDAPIMSWYSSCEAYAYAATAGESRLPVLHGEDRFMVVREDGLFQPDEAYMQTTYLSHAELMAEFRNGYGDVAARLYRITD